MGARKVQAYLHGMEEAIRAINKWNDHQGGYENLEKHIEAINKWNDHQGGYENLEKHIEAINKWNDHQGGYENLEKHIEALKKGLSGAEAALEEASKAETKMRRAIVDARVEIMNGYPNKATKILQEAL
jgi:DNA repair exonuclease SbcCD ATPase subunit